MAPSTKLRPDADKTNSRDVNFRYMPELGFRYGYPIVQLAMVASCIVLYVVFKRIGWL